MFDIMTFCAYYICSSLWGGEMSKEAVHVHNPEKVFVEMGRFYVGLNRCQEKICGKYLSCVIQIISPLPRGTNTVEFSELPPEIGRPVIDIISFIA